MLSRYNIKCVGLPHSNIFKFHRQVKGDFGLKTPGIYSITYECGNVYFGQKSHSTETSIKQHRHIWLAQSEKSAAAEHSFTQDQVIQLHDTNILSNKSVHMDRLIMEAIKLELQPNNMNRAESFKLSNSWKPLIQLL